MIQGFTDTGTFTRDGDTGRLTSDNGDAVFNADGSVYAAAGVDISDISILNMLLEK